ncbi:hypothetical protein [Streptomyces sp. NBC_01465]|uniref:hypothetical protein n=1 Tax=Streptomyces sp. NBC_01465 TaxID=2903878 RepID=UPI002E36C4DD|nr:hypothetical protein [Streptomyces sp. NBC_01465]
MGALRRLRYRRTLAAGGVAVAAVVGLAACDPVGGMNSAAVAYTTDQMATKVLERAGVKVNWLSCTATLSGGGTATPTASPSKASVDCQGRTDDNKKITVNGTVTYVRDGSCVKGHLTAKVGAKTMFTATVLGDCNAAPSNGGSRRTTPPAGGGGVRPAVTVTVTVTEYPQGK